MRWSRLALSGHSLRHNSLSAFGPKRTLVEFWAGTVCPLMTQERQIARRYAAPHCEFKLYD
jgi:hypothetical protein